MTPKERVIKKHPRAYCAAYGVQVFVYKEPMTAQPRGKEQAAIALGSGTSYRHAWADASRRMKGSNAEVRDRPHHETTNGEKSNG